MSTSSKLYGPTGSPTQPLDELCRAVELFRAAVLPTIPLAPAPPDGVALWEGRYACVILWPVPETTADALRAATTRGQDWADAVLGETERKVPTRVIDGYLILALTSAPSEKLYNQIRDIELSTQVCRKHVVWPTLSVGTSASIADDIKGKGQWERLTSVTVLGLPADGAPSVPSGSWPHLPSAAAQLWNDVETMGFRNAAENDLAEL